MHCIVITHTHSAAVPGEVSRDQSLVPSIANSNVSKRDLPKCRHGGVYVAVATQCQIASCKVDKLIRVEERVGHDVDCIETLIDEFPTSVTVTTE